MLHPYSLDKPLAAVIGKLPRQLKPVMQFATFIAAPLQIAVILGSLLSYSVFTSNYDVLKGLVLVILAAPLAELTKFITRRKRPETLYVEQMRFKTFSFPSGHSYIAMLVFGFIAVLVSGTALIGTITSIMFITLIFAVGISRIYLGAHFPSDVLAGWLLGAVVLYGILTAESSLL